MKADGRATISRRITMCAINVSVINIDVKPCKLRLRDALTKVTDRQRRHAPSIAFTQSRRVLLCYAIRLI